MNGETEGNEKKYTISFVDDSDEKASKLTRLSKKRILSSSSQSPQIVSSTWVTSRRHRSNLFRTQGEEKEGSVRVFSPLVGSKKIESWLTSRVSKIDGSACSSNRRRPAEMKG